MVIFWDSINSSSTGAATIRLASRGLVDSAIVCHPGPCTIAEIKAISIPTSWVCAEGMYSFRIWDKSVLIIQKEDEWFGPKLRAEAEAAFAAKKDKPEFVEYEFRDYKGKWHCLSHWFVHAISCASQGRCMDSPLVQLCPFLKWRKRSRILWNKRLVGLRRLWLFD